VGFVDVSELGRQQAVSSVFLLVSLFNPECGGDMFLCNIRLSELCGVAGHKTIIFIVIVKRTSNPT
jgi:hypothetical protein